MTHSLSPSRRPTRPPPPPPRRRTPPPPADHDEGTTTIPIELDDILFEEEIPVTDRDQRI